MNRWAVRAAIVVALPVALLAFDGCRHLGIGDGADGGAGVSCTPCSEYALQTYWCVANACAGLKCVMCEMYLHQIPEPACIADGDGGSGAVSSADAGSGGCACDMTYGCDPSCPCDPDCNHPGGSDAGASPCTGTHRKLIEDRLRTFSCDEYLAQNDIDSCLTTAISCPAAGGICESGYVYYVSGTSPGCACLPPGTTGVGGSCTAPNDCIPGAVCFMGDGAKHCVKVCVENGECGDGGVCVPSRSGFSACYYYQN